MITFKTSFCSVYSCFCCHYLTYNGGTTGYSFHNIITQFVINSIRSSCYRFTFNSFN